MSSAPYQPDLLALTRNLQNLHLRFWDQGDAARAIIISAETHQLGDETRIFELMTLGPSFETFFSGRSTIIAREEYKRLIAELSTPSDLHCGVTLLGQPGVGKSTFMHYFLVERILGGRRTMFQCHQDTIYELNKDGVQVWPATKFSATPSLDWVLVDINESLTTSNINLDDHFVIAAFGPRHEDWWGWYQSRDCELAVMRPWTKHEIVYAGLRICSPPLDADRLQGAFLNHGPSPRLCFFFAEYPQCMAEWQSDTARTIARVKERLVFASSFPGPHCEPSLFHQVFLLDRRNDGDPQISIMSPLVVQLITEELDRRDGKGGWEDFNIFDDEPSFHESGRRIWALHSISVIVGGEARRMKLYCFTKPPNANKTLQTIALALPLPPPIPYDTLKSWPQELLKLQTRPALFQLRTRNEDAFDGILVAQSHIACFETTVRRHLDTSTTGIYGRLDSLVGFLKDANMTDWLPSESYKWRLVFLVPKRNLPGWRNAYCWAGTGRRGAGSSQAREDWMDHVDIYVSCPEVMMEDTEKPPLL